MRLNKFIAQSGYCSRRKADELISQGKVLINNVPVREMGIQIDPEIDQIRIKGGQSIKLPRKSILILFHKPKGYLCTKADTHKRRTIYDILPDGFQNLNSIGRLDMNSEGLLLLTNDGSFSQSLAHPRFKKRKVYEVTVRGKVEEKELEKIRKGMNLREYHTNPAGAKMLKYLEKDNRTVLEITLSEGKKRQIRNMFLYLKKPVKRLLRIQFGKYRLGNLKVGEWRQFKLMDKC